MPRRFYLLGTNEIYHVFNRAIGNEEIFVNKWKLKHFLDLIDYYRYPQKIRYSKFTSLSQQQKKDYISNISKLLPLVEIYSFALMPNHFHFLIKQKQDNGIKLFISNLQNSYAKYFNLSNNRHGGLFQNSFKAKRVETDEEFIHISRYIHLNPVTSFLIDIKDLSVYPWNSYTEYVDENNVKFIDTKVITEIVGSKKKYQQFVIDQADYQRKLYLVKRLLLE